MILFCRNRVQDFDRWKKVFDEHSTAHQAAGLRLLGLWREADDPKNVFFSFSVKDRGRAQTFMDDPAAADAGRRSGVIDGEVYFLHESPEESPDESPEERVI